MVKKVNKIIDIYYMSLLDNKYLFVHVNKSGGAVITNNISRKKNVKITGYHRSLHDMLDICEKQYKIDKEKLFIFSIVRNPWARMLSMYLYYKKFINKWPEFFSKDEIINSDFNKWINFIYSYQFDRSKIHSKVNVFKYCFCNQLNWFKDLDGNLIEYSKIYKYEECDYEKILRDELKLVDIDIETKIHPTSHSHYRNYYDKKSKELVEKHYSEDIKHFGYIF